MNRIIVDQFEPYGGSAFKVINCIGGDYNIGDLVEVLEDGDKRLSVIVERNFPLAQKCAGCNDCIFKCRKHEGSCGYVTSDGWFPCMAVTQNSCIQILFKPVDSIMEEL